MTLRPLRVLTDAQEAEAVRLYVEEMWTLAELAARFEVGQTAVRNVLVAEGCGEAGEEATTTCLFLLVALAITQVQMPEYNLRIDELVRNPDRHEEWTREFCRQAAVRALRGELERRQVERLNQQGWLGRLTTRMFGPLLTDPIEIMFGPKDADLRTGR